MEGCIDVHVWYNAQSCIGIVLFISRLCSFGMRVVRSLVSYPLNIKKKVSAK